MAITRLIPAVAVVVLSVALFTITKDNAHLRTELSAAIDSIAASKGACILPTAQGRSLTTRPIKLSFPNDQPTLILASRHDCKYCKSVLLYWSKIVGKFPQVRSFVYDPSSSYSVQDLEESKISSETVISNRIGAAPYNELLNSTPTIVLVGTSGRVLAVWAGELSEGRVNTIVSVINHLLNEK